MGMHYLSLGFKTVQEFVTSMQESERNHLLAFVRFIKFSRLDTALRLKQWDRFVEGYNGSGYKFNKYDLKLLAAYKKHAR